VINQTETDAREENMHGRLIASFIAFSVTMGNALAADTIKIAYITQPASSDP